MVTNLSISRLMPLPKNDAIAAARKKWNLRNNKQYKKKKTVYQAKQEVCAKITGCPAYGKGARVALTHKNMTHIAEMIDEYKSKWFSRFDRVLTAWLRPKVENKQYYASCWKQFSGEAVVRPGDFFSYTVHRDRCCLLISLVRTGSYVSSGFVRRCTSLFRSVCSR